MALSDMEVFNKYFMPATYDTLAQMVDKFNAASAGAIVLSMDGFEGDYEQVSFFDSLAAARRRVDRYGTNSSVSPTNLTQSKNSAVKVAGGFGPVQYEPGQMTWLRKPTAEGIEVASMAFAELLLQDQLNTAIAALVAAIENQAAATNDVSASGALTYAAINGAHAKFGDASGRIVANVMNGVSYHNLIGQNLTNSTRLFQAGNVTIVDILNKATIVTDAPALYEAGSPTNKSKALGLVSGAAVVTDSGDVISNIETSNGLQRIVTTMQVDYTFGLRLKGFGWDTANGGPSPTDADLATGSNWTLTTGDIKNSAGVIAIGDTDA